MKVNELEYVERQTVCPKCLRPVSSLQMDCLVNDCACGFKYKNEDLKIRITNYKRPEVESVVIV